MRDSEGFGVVEVGKHFMAVFIDEKPLHSKSNWVVMGSISMIVTSYSLRRSKMSGSSYASLIIAGTHPALSIKVAEAAATKCNFLPFKLGMVGGHFIGVDPYYLA